MHPSFDWFCQHRRRRPYYDMGPYHHRPMDIAKPSQWKTKPHRGREKPPSTILELRRVSFSLLTIGKFRSNGPMVNA